MKIPSTVPEIPSTPICRPGGVLKISLLNLHTVMFELFGGQERNW